MVDIVGEQTNENRHIALEGGHNFRDLGGYSTEDGRQLRRGLVYRSGSLAHLTPGDHVKLSALRLRVIFDLRGNEERRRRPIHWPATPASAVWARNHDETAADILDFLLQPGITSEDTRRLMIDAYRRIPYDQSESYREIFRSIARGDVPILIHCSAGKDRTGIVAALLLSALGVPRSTVIADYLESGRNIDRSCQVALDDHVIGRLSVLPSEVWMPMMRAESAYIEAMFDQILTNHGSVASFLDAEFGLEPEILTALRSTMIAGDALVS